MQSTVEADTSAKTADNVIVVAACPVDQTLNRSLGVLGTAHQFVCRKCKSMYTLAPASAIKL